MLRASLVKLGIQAKPIMPQPKVQFTELREFGPLLNEFCHDLRKTLSPFSILVLSLLFSIIFDTLDWIYYSIKKIGSINI